VAIRAAVNSERYV